MSWNNVSQQLPKINTDVFIFNKDETKIFRARLCIYNGQQHITNNKLKQGDIFWEITPKWATIENFPYWINRKTLVQLIKQIIPIEKMSELDIVI